MSSFREIYQKFQIAKKQILKEIGDLAVNHFVDAFKNEGLEGEPKWQKRKDGSSDESRNKRRGLLVKTGKLRRSIRIVRISANQVTIGSDVPYAKVQNEGGTTHPSLTEKSRKYFWRQYKQTKNPKWKAMASSKKSSFTVNIPPRPFMKVTSVLKQKIKAQVEQRLKEVFK